METWYAVNRYGEWIVPVEVVSSTEKTVLVQEKRCGKVKQRRKSRDGVFKTWEEAHAHLLERTKARLESARRNLQAAQGKYGNVLGMKKP